MSLKNFSALAFRRVHPSYSLVGFLLGVVAGDIFTLATRQAVVWYWAWAACAGLVLIITLIRPVWWMVLLSFAAGLVCINYRAGLDLAGADYFRGLVGETVSLTGTVSADPETTEQKTTLVLSNLRVGEAGATAEKSAQPPGAVYVQLAVNHTIQRSDIVAISGKISSGFGTYAAMVYRPTVEEVTRPEPGDVFLKARNWFAERVRGKLSEEEASLGLGYLLGMRSGLPADLVAALRVVGLTHIVVASGAHMSILVGFMRKIFGRFSRFAGAMFGTLMVVAFMGVVGLTPSIVRAGLVSLLSLLAWYVGRKFKPWRLLLMVAGATLLYSPMYLLNLGWLLSFAAFAGIMILGPELAKFFYGEAEPGWLAGILIETIAASLLCAPILIYFFGTLSLLALVTNVLIPPTLALAMGLVFLTGITAGVTIIGTVVSRLAALILEYHLAVINYFGSKEMFLVELPAEDWRVFLLYLPICLPFLVKTLYNMYKCRGKHYIPKLE